MVFSVRPFPFFFINASSPSSALFARPSLGFYLHTSELRFLKLLRLRRRDGRGETLLFDEHAGFSRLFGISVNSTVFEWQQRSSGGSLMIQQHGAI